MNARKGNPVKVFTGQNSDIINPCDQQLGLLF